MKEVLTLVLAAVMVSAWILPEAIVFAEDTSDTVIEAGTEGDPTLVSTPGTAGEPAEEDTGGTSGEPAGDNAGGTAENNTAAVQTASENFGTVSSEGSGDAEVEDGSASGTVDDQSTSDFSYDETGKVAESDSDNASLNAGLSSARGTMLMSPAPEQADYEGFEVTGDLSFYFTNNEGIRINSWFNQKDGIYYLFSVSDDADIITAAMKSFNEKVNRLMNVLNYADPNTLPLYVLSSYLDVESAVKWYLVNEFAFNTESMGTSFFWYTDGDDDVLHLGPVWDFDSALGNKDVYEPGIGNVDRAILFNSLLQYKCFRDNLYSVYDSYRDLFAGVSDYAQIIKETIENSAEMNYIR